MREFFTSILKQFISSLITFVVCYFILLWAQKEVKTPHNPILAKLDSLQLQSNVLKSHIDSINLLKKEQLNVYYKTKWKYDTLKITIDTMPPLDATKLLLSKSRQLTNQGIE